MANLALLTQNEHINQLLFIIQVFEYEKYPIIVTGYF